ncbi:MAG: hypothetical protein WBB31_15800 [Saprospiraceae bacterium]
MNDIVNDEDIRTLFTKDKTFEHIHHLYGTPPNWSRPQGFVSLSKTILEQQVSLASANAHFQKLNGYIKEFTPSEILSLSDEEMKACQISRQKAKYLRELSTAILERKLNLDELSNLDEADVRTRLMAIKGIGTWTSDIYLMFCLQAKDIFPLGDIAVINTVKELTNIHNREEIYKLSEKWKPLRSLAAYFFWHYYLCKRRR